ncbi:cytochrome c [Aequorivita viscosa]|uniref:Cytochrome c, mono-and diheme variants n=1 Tax=Aequorivita viscosa TaxID=797419 RepID=A0A1M6EBL6_9FLAO|nr:cytochrome c [Aequorivita viscosa]SDW00751.1 Cytochrome c, mono-and diheme variants [Aequorivita viscosa]SHI82690.1 Cytochrome c, mono-and diheme variants [Aequorivita viscosa]
MKHLIKSFAAFAIIALVGCGGKEEKKEDSSVKIRAKPKTEVKQEAPAKSDVKPSQMVDLTNKGVGPIKNVELGETIDQAMAAKGAEVFKMNCTACHKTDKKFIGPAPKGILERRTPEWIMNMIMDPEGMVNNDPLAKALLMEFNGSPMANQNMTEEQSRQILEYFRTL